MLEIFYDMNGQEVMRMMKATMYGGDYVAVSTGVRMAAPKSDGLPGSGSSFFCTLARSSGNGSATVNKPPTPSPNLGGPYTDSSTRGKVAWRHRRLQMRAHLQATYRFYHSTRNNATNFHPFTVCPAGSIGHDLATVSKLTEELCILPGIGSSFFCTWSCDVREELTEDTNGHDRHVRRWRRPVTKLRLFRLTGSSGPLTLPWPPVVLLPHTPLSWG